MGYWKQAATHLVVTTVLLLIFRAVHQSKFVSYNLFTHEGASTKTVVEQNIIVMFAGRWKFMRVNFPYIYRDLRENGGVVDKVWYMMVKYDKKTETHLKKLVKEANEILGRDAFELKYMGYPPGKPPKKYSPPYHTLFPDLIRNPYNRYFKLDDDIVYIHPKTFERMIESKKTCGNQCFMHFGNIVTNWRCSITHERMGLFNNSETNPKSLKFDYSPYAKCGWKSSECADVVLKTFLYHYRKKQLNQYIFDGCEQLLDRQRFSINFFMLHKDLINIEVMFQAGPIGADDEAWWTTTYSSNSLIKEPNCIVGGGFVVHFSYYTTSEAMLKKGYLRDFEAIALQEVGPKVPGQLWTLLDLSTSQKSSNSR